MEGNLKAVVMKSSRLDGVSWSEVSCAAVHQSTVAAAVLKKAIDG